MDLFVINRYLGDDKNIKASDEKTKLDLLLSKVKERIKQRDAVHKVKDTTVTEDPSVGEIHVSHLDKDLVEKEVRTPISDKEKKKQGEEEDTEVVSKKRHKRNRKQVELDEEVEDEDKTKDNKGTKDKITPDGFTVIGVDKFKKKQKVKRVLPHWLAKPSIVSINLQHLTTTVKEIPGLDKDLIRALQRNNITHFFPVQAQVIPWLLAAHSTPRQYWPHDVCVSAPTGSGKTLAFVIPIIQALRPRMVVKVRALVVLPVQDLAVQVYKVFLTYTEHTDLKVALITGQTSFQAEQQQLVTCGAVSGHRSVVDIVVTTPGRLVDHLQSTHGFTLRYLRFLVIDEADRVIENVQNDWLYHLYSHIHTDNRTGYHGSTLTIATLESTLTPPPQKLLFSATLTQDPEKLQQLGLFQPKLFTSVVGGAQTGAETQEISRGDFVGKYTTPAELTEQMCIVTPESKPLVLFRLVTKNRWKHVLVFVGSRKDAHRLSLLLTHLGQGKLKVAEISSSLSRPEREKILDKFAAGKLDMIVSSDALARGMDIEGVDYVVLYSTPKSVKNYIHRIGRTGRAGKPGTAVTLLLENQVGYFNEMLRIAGKDSVQNLVVEQSELEEMEEAYSSALEQLKLDMEQEAELHIKVEKQNKKMDPLIKKLRERKRQLKVKKRRKQMKNVT